MARFDLTDFEWSVIQPLLPTGPQASEAQRAWGEAGLCPVGFERDILAVAHWSALGRYSGALRSVYNLCEPVQPLAQGRRVGAYIGCGFSSL